MIMTWRQMLRRGALAIAMALALSCGSLGPANALSIGDNGTLGVPSTEFFFSSMSGAPFTEFSDSYTFFVDSEASLEAFVLNFNMFASTNIDELQITLKIFGEVDPLAQSGVGDGSGFEVLTVGLSSLVTNVKYALIVTGEIAAGASFGAYAGSMELTAVPAPAALPLFGAALMLGFGFMRRRIRADAGHAFTDQAGDVVPTGAALTEI